MSRCGFCGDESRNFKCSKCVNLENDVRKELCSCEVIKSASVGYEKSNECFGCDETKEI
jgi:hypothetical protein